MFDTNVVSQIMQGREPRLLKRLTSIPVGEVAISSITLAELEYGLNRKGQAERLRTAMAQFLLRVDVWPWDDKVAICYGAFSVKLEKQGINLSDFDMMIAAHAVATNAILVSRDKAFTQIADGLRLEIW